MTIPSFCRFMLAISCAPLAKLKISQKSNYSLVDSWVFKTIFLTMKLKRTIARIMQHLRGICLYNRVRIYWQGTTEVCYFYACFYAYLMTERSLRIYGKSPHNKTRSLKVIQSISILFLLMMKSDHKAKNTPFTKTVLPLANGELRRPTRAPSIYVG